MTTERDEGELLQRHGDSGETRAHWHTDDGGGRWVGFVSWSLFDGNWTGYPTNSISTVALAEMIRLHAAGEPRVAAEPIVHGAGPGPAATHCGLPFTADLRLSAKRSRITCPACLTAMVEPRVVSGTDAVAATPEPVHAFDGGHFLIRIGDRTRCGADMMTGLLFSSVAVAVTCPACLGREAAPPPPARPSRVEVGQRRRHGPYVYTVIEAGRSGYWRVRYDDGVTGRDSEDRIIADEFLGLAAPVETPPTEPAKPGERKWCGRFPGDSCGDSPCCRESPAAPAPGVGPMTCKQACEADEAGDNMEWSLDSGATWSKFDGFEQEGTPGRFQRARYRRRPGPLPAPAPRVSRVRELVREYLMGETTADSLCERVVDAHQEEIRLQAMDAGWCDGNLEALELVQDRARAAMLEPKP
jgi:hypothetical protein